MRRILLLSLATAASLWLCACSDQKVPLNNPHGADVLAHADLARSNEQACALCHGDDFLGGSSGVSCFRCHDSGPPFSMHPAGWSNVLVDHATFADSYHWSYCATAKCHGTDLKGSVEQLIPGPGCFDASCHDTLPLAIHNTPYVAPASHGSASLSNLQRCFNCHGDLPNLFDGGFVAATDIMNKPNGACDVCHPAAGAHPTNWQGTNDLDASYVSSHRRTPNAGMASCALCHDLTGTTTPAPLNAPGCYSAGFTNANGSVSSCHPGGPTGHPLGEPWLNPASDLFHGDSALTCANCHNLTTKCSTCHFGPTGSLSPSTSWTHGFSGHRSYQAYQTVCNRCHTLTRSFGLGPASCHDCHGD